MSRHPIFAIDKKPNPTRLFRAKGPINWPSFNGIATLLGASPSGKTKVYYDATLGAQALANAQALLADADRVTSLNNSFFGVSGGAVSVVLFALSGQTDGSGGADHLGCDFTSGSMIEVCVAYNNNPLVSGLFEAELSENMMNGQLCGLSTGEALSRWCAASVAPQGTFDAFASVPQWQADNYPNFVDTTDPSDQNIDSIGCGMAFISWLIGKGFQLSSIAPAMVALGDTGTLAQLYNKLTGDAQTNAWTKFLADVKALNTTFSNDHPFLLAGLSVKVGGSVSYTAEPIDAQGNPYTGPLPGSPSWSHTSAQNILTASGLTAKLSATAIGADTVTVTIGNFNCTSAISAT
jgi:hypothetical protein